MSDFYEVPNVPQTDGEDFKRMYKTSDGKIFRTWTNDTNQVTGFDVQLGSLASWRMVDGRETFSNVFYNDNGGKYLEINVTVTDADRIDFHMIDEFVRRASAIDKEVVFFVASKLKQKWARQGVDQVVEAGYLP